MIRTEKRPTFKLVLTIAFAFAIVIESKSQDSIRNIEFGADLMKVATAFQDLKKTRLKITYKLSRMTSSLSQLDSTEASFQLNDGKLLGNLQGITLLSNAEHCLTIDPDETVIAISSRNEGSIAFDFGNLDSLFIMNHMLGFDREKVGDDLYLLRVSFHPDSYYKRFEMLYNHRFLLQKVEVETLDLDYGEDGLPPSVGARKLMQVIYGPYESDHFDDSLFDDDQIIKKDGDGKWVGIGKYSTWQVIDTQRNP